MNSKYKQDKASSAEILRLILPKMTVHPGSFTPTTYAVWYEFLAGINPPLSEAMNKLLGEQGQLTTDLAENFYNLYVSEIDPQEQAICRQKMQKLLDELAMFAESTGLETNRFSSSLQKHREAMDTGVDASSLKNMLGEIMQDTQSMRGSVESLQGKLYESKSEVEKLQQELQNARHEALSDPMTGVFNRRGFDVEMERLLATPELQGKRICFMMLDIDYFKKVNDTYGHLFGDKVIRGVAAALTARVKGQDSVARMGGEEFAVILPDTPLQGAYVLAEQIRQNIANSKIRRSEKEVAVEGITISIGIADCVVGGDWMDALSHADEALFASKKQGRNRTTIYTAIK